MQISDSWIPFESSAELGYRCIAFILERCWHRLGDLGLRPNMSQKLRGCESEGFPVDACTCIYIHVYIYTHRYSMHIYICVYNTFIRHAIVHLHTYFWYSMILYDSVASWGLKGCHVIIQRHYSLVATYVSNLAVGNCHVQQENPW